MDALIGDLLVFNRLGRTPVCLGPVALSIVIPEVLRAFSRDIRDRGAGVDVDVPPLEAVADGTMLFLVCCHLLSNALKFVAPGTAPRVRIRAERRADRVRITFEDNGIGIPDEYSDRIFGVFQRLNKAEAYSGTGIGLAIVRRATERMSGRVGLESEVGKGSRFWVELLGTLDQGKAHRDGLCGPRPAVPFVD
jgi:signal transduction histidine kinase